MTRHDLYRTVHKGLRAALFEAAREVARTDFAVAQEAGTAAATVRRVLGFLSEHAEHEDDRIDPALADVAPDLARELALDHARLEGVGSQALALVDRLETAGEAERVDLGSRLHRTMGRLVAEHLAHMEREEGEACAALWSAYSNAELLGLEQAIVGSIPPARLADWLELMLPAMNRPERRELVAGLVAALPREEFQTLTGPASAVLGRELWADACTIA